ncbi:MAG: ISNCY family transposase [Oscillospiraceae bacterium]|nr:ISNCY family transposase [Oscillospiraceae bacterium]
MNDQVAYEVIKELADHGGNKERAALTLGCTRRTIDRHIAGYRAEGKAYFIHGNRGRQPSHALEESKKSDIRDLYLNKYYDTNFAHFAELLGRFENIHISESAVRNILSAEEVLSPRATRRTRREFKKRLEAALKAARGKKEETQIQKKIIDADDPHPRRPRCANFGEMIQMDASLHLWAGGRKWTLHIAIDDATGIIVGAWFEEQETLRGYYNVLRQILTKNGIPFMFYTDRRTVFEYRKSGSKDAGKDTFTQFSYACKQLGIQIETTSVAQAKGRVERLIQTMQSRLPVELRLEGVTTIEQANEFLPGFIAHYNARFALPSDNIPSVFEAQPSQEKIDMTLAVICERTVDNGHSISFDKTYFRTLNRAGRVDYLHKGTKGLVIRTLSGSLFFSVDEHVFAMEEIPLHERSSKNFDFKPPTDKPRKQYIPPANHPWRLAAFTAFAKKQASMSA